MIDGSTDWTELREFRHVELTRSYVVAWQVAGSTLKIEVDLCLAQGHAFYEAPRPAEKACFRAATIEFPDCTGVGTGDPPLMAEPAQLEAPEVGLISGMERVAEGEYRIEGAFGAIRIIAGRPVVRLANRFFR